MGIKRKNLEIIPYWDTYIKAAKDASLKLMNWNVWNKCTCSIGNSHTTMFPIVHEFVFVFGSKIKETNKIVPKKTFGKDNRLYNTHRDPDGSLKLFKRNSSSDPMKRMESVLTCAPAITPDERQHPAAFSIKFAESYILAMTNENDIVVDCFGGGGTTLIACEKTNRRCLMMEINDNYIKLIKDRYKKFTVQNNLF